MTNEKQIIECVPNFSEGRDMSIIKQITDAIDITDNILERRKHLSKEFRDMGDQLIKIIHPVCTSFLYKLHKDKTPLLRYYNSISRIKMQGFYAKFFIVYIYNKMLQTFKV